MSWTAWALCSACFAALTAILAKVGVERVSADTATFVRTAVVFAALACLLAATGQWPRWESIPRRSYVFLALSGLATGASWLCYFRALKSGPASLVAPIDKLSILLVALFAALWLGERITLRSGIGIALIAAGAVLVGWRR